MPSDRVENESNREDYTCVRVELTEEHMEDLEHGEGVTFEFHGDEGQTLAVMVDRADLEPGKEYILAKATGRSPSGDGPLERLRGFLS